MRAADWHHIRQGKSAVDLGDLAGSGLNVCLQTHHFVVFLQGALLSPPVDALVEDDGVQGEGHLLDRFARPIGDVCGERDVVARRKDVLTQRDAQGDGCTLEAAVVTEDLLYFHHQGVLE